MPKAMDFIQFKKRVQEYNLRIVMKTKHSSIVVDEDGNFVMAFSISHKKGGKDYVKGNYVNDLEKVIERIK